MESFDKRFNCKAPHDINRERDLFYLPVVAYKQILMTLSPVKSPIKYREDDDDDNDNGKDND